MASDPLGISGIDRVVKDIVDHEGRIDKETRRVLAKSAQRVRRKQRQLVPKKERHLMRAISYRIRGTRWSRTALVGPLFARKTKDGSVPTHYGIFQEFGTSRHKATPFVRPSLDGEAERLAADLNAMNRKF